MRWFPLAPRESSLECPGIVMIAQAAGENTVSNAFWIQEPFNIVSPLEVRKSHCFHSITKSRATPDANQLSV